VPIQSGYHSRGYLPHIKVEGAAYFVTFRLADSLPRYVVTRLKEQRDDLLHRSHTAANSEDDLRRAVFAWYAAEVDSLLDRNLGVSWLRDERIAGLVAEALRHFAGHRHTLHAWCAMPNHVHVVIRPTALHTLDTILQSWKSYTAHAANRLLGRTGPFWQRESYDHWIRDDADLTHCCRYTEENPVKAGLCKSASDWPWSSTSK
jgi:REP element-mobilizing transposase RayT